MNNLLLRRRMLMQAGGSPTPPIPYQRIEYLESSGTQYINTNILQTADMNFYTESQNLDASGDRKFFGVSVDFGLAQLSGRWRLAANWISTSKAVDTNKHIIYQDGSQYYIDGVSLGTSSTRARNLKIYLFLMNNGNNQAGGDAYIRIYRFKITDTNGNLYWDGYPVRVGTVGYMYDTVSHQLFGNAGTGDFILGPDIN